MILYICFFIVGNKNDTPERKVVITEDARRFADSMVIPLFETSAKDNINVEEMFLQVTKMVFDLFVKIGGVCEMNYFHFVFRWF